MISHSPVRAERYGRRGGSNTGPPRSGKTDTRGVSTLCPSEVMTHSKKLVVRNPGRQTHPQEKSSKIGIRPEQLSCARRTHTLFNDNLRTSRRRL